MILPPLVFPELNNGDILVSHFSTTKGQVFGIKIFHYKCYKKFPLGLKARVFIYGDIF